MDGDIYVTCEMWMMVQKERLFGDEKVARDMLKTKDPKAHKALGRQVQGFDNRTWNQSESSRVFHLVGRSFDACGGEDVSVLTSHRQI